MHLGLTGATARLSLTQDSPRLSARETRWEPMRDADRNRVRMLRIHRIQQALFMKARDTQKSSCAYAVAGCTLLACTGRSGTSGRPDHYLPTESRSATPPVSSSLVAPPSVTSSATRFRYQVAFHTRRGDRAPKSYNGECARARSRW